MTEKLGALGTLARAGGDAGKKALADFYDKYQDTNNVVDKWLSLSTSTADGNAAEVVKTLLKHPAFDLTNPNKVRNLMGGFAANSTEFHKKDGSGYKTLADVVIDLNAINPRVAAQIVRPLTQFKRYGADRQSLMLKELERIIATPNLFKGLKEVVGQAIATADKPKTAAASFDAAANKTPANDTGSAQQPKKKAPGANKP
jgi:aminopeptidase N